MERQQRRRNAPGREYGSHSSRRPYSDEQETYRNPRNEYEDADRDYGGDPDVSRYGSSEPRYRSYRDRGYLDRGYRGDTDSDHEAHESRRGMPSQRGYGYGDSDYRDDWRGRYEPGYGAHRQEGRRDSWSEPREGDFPDARSRWPRDDAYRSEPRSQNWPHSRSGGRVSEYGYFEGDRSERYGGHQRGYGQQSGTGHGNRRFDEDYSGRGPKNYSRSDQRIKEDICDELESDPECNAEEIEIEVKDGNVTLSGTVPSRHMKHRAEDIADGTRGVKDIENRIRVTRNETGGARSGQQSSSGTPGKGDREEVELRKSA